MKHSKWALFAVAPLLVTLMALPRCSEMGREYDNPWDKEGTNYNGGSWTVTFNACSKRR